MMRIIQGFTRDSLTYGSIGAHEDAETAWSPEMDGHKAI